MNNEIVVLGGGCFWCVEAGFQNLPGIHSVTSGYAGGHSDKPDYKSVCSGETGHAEVIRLEFDATVISLTDILDLFFHLHDPTTLNRQGNDIGTQYRSIILYANDNQVPVIDEAIKTAQKEASAPVVTQVEKLTEFYPAENYHHNYFQDNPNQPYCSAVISPKLKKFRAYLASKNNR